MVENKPLERFKCEEYEIIEIYDTIIRVIVPKLDNSKLEKRHLIAPREGTYTYDIGTLGLDKMDIDEVIEDGGIFFGPITKAVNEQLVYLSEGQKPPNAVGVNQIVLHSETARSPYKKLTKLIKSRQGEILEERLDYNSAIAAYEKFGKLEDAKRLRQKILDQKRVDQTVVHGDYVDDRDTIVKDSVINRSNIGTGGDDRFARLEKLTEMKEKGHIEDDEFKQMKKEILGK